MPPREAYSLWAARYPPRPHNRLMAAEQAVVAPLLARLGARCALDLGTGTGRNLALLVSAGARLAVGLDLSPAMLAHHEVSTTRVQADATCLPFRTGAFDVVSSSLMAGDIADLRGLIGEASRVLAPGGHLVYSDFHPSWVSRQWRRTFRSADGREIELPYHPHAMDVHLDALAAAGLEVRTIREPRVNEQPVVIVIHATRL